MTWVSTACVATANMRLSRLWDPLCMLAFMRLKKPPPRGASRPALYTCADQGERGTQGCKGQGETSIPVISLYSRSRSLCLSLSLSVSLSLSFSFSRSLSNKSEQNENVKEKQKTRQQAHTNTRLAQEKGG